MDPTFVWDKKLGLKTFFVYHIFLLANVTTTWMSESFELSFKNKISDILKLLPR